MEIQEIARRLELCSAEAKRVNAEREQTWQFFVYAVKIGDGLNADLARQMLHAHFDAQMDNFSSALTLNELLQKAIDTSGKA